MIENQEFIKKELVGLIGNRPVYKIINADLTKVPFKINARTLLIGDGIDTPVLVVKDALKAMYHYILEEEDVDLTKYIDGLEHYGLTDEEILRYIVFNHDDKGHFIYHNFSAQDHLQFQEMCKSKLLKVPYCEKKSNGNFNNWLHLNIGAFVWFYCNEVTNLTPFSSYDYFNENYLENTTLSNKSNNILGIPQNTDTFKNFGFTDNNKIQINLFSSEEEAYLLKEIIAGNNWLLEEVYWFYKHKS